MEKEHAREQEEAREAQAQEKANEISATLHALGLAHVPVHVVTRQVS